MNKTKKKTATLDSLEGMVQRGFVDVDKRFDGVDKRLDYFEGQLDHSEGRFENLEKIILHNYHDRISRL